MSKQQQQPELNGDLNEIQQQMDEWRQGEFPDSDAFMMLIGMQEELGELSHSVCKTAEGYRLESDKVGPEAEKDAIGDLIVFAMGLASYRGYDIEECIEMATTTVLTRDWDALR